MTWLGGSGDGLRRGVGGIIGGSSTGSAVAVGANVIAFALGTETDGSGEFSRWLHVVAVAMALRYHDKLLFFFFGQVLG